VTERLAGTSVIARVRQYRGVTVNVSDLWVLAVPRPTRVRLGWPMVRRSSELLGNWFESW
jgi:hypothetical protein